MNSNDEFSLRETLKKRKLQRSLSGINNLPTKITQPILVPSPSTQTEKVAPASTQRAATEHDFRQTAEEVVYAAKNFTRRYPRLTVLAAFGCILVCLSVLILLSLPRAQAQALVSLPLVSINDVVNHLRSVGLPLGDAESYADGSKWSAAQSVRFDVPDKGYVVVFSYADQVQTNDNAFKLQFAPEYAEWRQISLTNIIVLASPEVSEVLFRDITNKLIQTFVAPYRSELSRN